MPLPINKCPVCRMVDEKGTIVLPRLPKSELDPLFTHITIHMLRREGMINEVMFKKLLELVDRKSEVYEQSISKYTDYARAEGVYRGLAGPDLEEFIRDYIDEENIALIFENWHRNGNAPKLKKSVSALDSIKRAFGGKQSWEKPLGEKTGMEVAQDVLEGRFRAPAAK